MFLTDFNFLIMDCNQTIHYGETIATTLGQNSVDLRMIIARNS